MPFAPTVTVRVAAPSATLALKVRFAASEERGTAEAGTPSWKSSPTLTAEYLPLKSRLALAPMAPPFMFRAPGDVRLPPNALTPRAITVPAFRVKPPP